MSFEAMALAGKIKTGSIATKAVLMAIANYADEHGVSWPSQVALADYIEGSEDTVRRALEKLEGIGLITRSRRTRKDGSRTSDLITLNLTGILQARYGEPNPQPAETLTSNLRHPNQQIAGGILEPIKEPITNNINAGARKAKPVSQNKKTKTEFPDDFELNETTGRVAAGFGWSQADIQNQIEIMRNWAKNADSGKDKKSDWQAFAQNWFRKDGGKKQNAAPKFKQSAGDKWREGIAASNAEALGRHSSNHPQDISGLSGAFEIYTPDSSDGRRSPHSGNRG